MAGSSSIIPKTRSITVLNSLGESKETPTADLRARGRAAGRGLLRGAGPAPGGRLLRCRAARGGLRGGGGARPLEVGDPLREALEIAPEALELVDHAVLE